MSDHQSQATIWPERNMSVRLSAFHLLLLAIGGIKQLVADDLLPNHLPNSDASSGDRSVECRMNFITIVPYFFWFIISLESLWRGSIWLNYPCNMNICHLTMGKLICTHVSMKAATTVTIAPVKVIHYRIPNNNHHHLADINIKYHRRSHRWLGWYDLQSSQQHRHLKLAFQSLQPHQVRSKLTEMLLNH